MRVTRTKHGRHAVRAAQPRHYRGMAPRTRALAIVVSATVVMGGMSAGAFASAAPRGQVTARTAVVNGTFESGNAGWQGGKNTHLSSAQGHKSSRAVRVSSTVNHSTTVLLNDSINSVKPTVAGHVYQASAWVRVERAPQSVAMRLLEEDSRYHVLSSKQTYQWRTNTLWTHITTTYTALRSTSSLDLLILGYGMKPGNALVVDDVAIVDLTAKDSTKQQQDHSRPDLIDRAPAMVDAPKSADDPTLSPVPATPPRIVPAPADPAGWHLAWSDEFNGSSINRNNWNVDNYSTYGDGNNELACLMDRPENLSVSGGLLTITARKEATPIKCGDKDSRFPGGRSYSSAMLSTKDKASFEYGRFDIRAKMPTSQGTSKGLWPAFWMRPAVGGIGELDVLELVGTGKADKPSANRVSQTIHYDYAPTYPMQVLSYAAPQTDFSTGFHDFAVEWEPGAIRWYVDGILTYTRNTTTTSWIDKAFVGNFYLRLNMAIGGNWPGSPDADTAFPASYQVDYVRVYKR